jgi:multiple sugar transport system substrate-binding protein
MLKSLRTLLPLLLVALLLIGAAPRLQAQGQQVIFISTQFNNVEETAKANKILADFKDGTAKYVGSEEGPLVDLLKAESQAGKGANDVVGALHGTFLSLVQGDIMLNQTDFVTELSKDVKIDPTLIELSKLGTKDFQYYVPWMQATYVMAASKDALQYLPEGADINNLTWDQLAAWAKALKDKTGKPQLAFPVKGLFHRFLEGYVYPSYTGGMVTNFRSKEAADMFRFLRDDLWPYVNPESINYDFMGARLQSGEVMLTWDHVARLKSAFDESPDKFVAFPAPSGPAGLGYMPVIAGLGMPATAPNPDGAKALIKFMLTPKTQAAVMSQLGFYPVVSDVDTKDVPAGVAVVFKAVQMQSGAKKAIAALTPIGLGSRGGDINQIYRNAFSRIVNDKQDIDTVLKEEGDNLQKLLTETGAHCWAPDPASTDVCKVK